MKAFIVIAALVLPSAAQAEQQIFRDSMGREIGRSSTDSRGNTTYSDPMGRNTGRSTTDGHGTKQFYDSLGRQTGRSGGGR